MPSQPLPPQYQAALLQQLLEQMEYGGGYQPQNFAPPGRVANYRTQYSPYLSDGSVADLVGRAMPDAKRFSADAFFDLDPNLKPIVANAVREYGHDPYGVYAAFDDPEYRYALLVRTLKDLNVDDFEPEIPQDRGGSVSYPNIDNVLDDLAARGDTRPVDYESPDILSGQYRGMAKRTKDVLVADLARKAMTAQQQALDDFVTQSAPSMERNANMTDFTWRRLGGMPYPGIDSEPLDYEGTGPAFPTATQTLSRGQAPRGQARPQPVGNWQQRLRQIASAPRR